MGADWLAKITSLYMFPSFHFFIMLSVYQNIKDIYYHIEKDILYILYMFPSLIQVTSSDATNYLWVQIG